MANQQTDSDVAIIMSSRRDLEEENDKAYIKEKIQAVYLSTKKY